MTSLLEIREKIKTFYAEYAYAVNLVLKFLLAMLVFLLINSTMGYMEALRNLYPVILLSLICSLVSVKVIVVMGGIMMLVHSYALGLEVLGITAVLLILLFLFFLRFDENESLAVLLTPLAFSLGLPCFIPICYGLKNKPNSAVSVGCGAVIYYYIRMLGEKAPILQNTDMEEMLTNLQMLLDGLLGNILMILSVFAAVLVVILVYVIRRLDIDYSWHIAIGAGAVVYLAIMISGGLFLDLDISPLKSVLGTIVSGLLAMVVEFFVLNVDYSRSERMEFEDDEYYYYVKAVPKITISQSRREIKTISGDAGETTPENEVSDTDSAEIQQEKNGLEQNDNLANYETKLDESLNEL